MFTDARNVPNNDAHSTGTGSSKASASHVRGPFNMFSRDLRPVDAADGDRELSSFQPQLSLSGIYSGRRTISALGGRSGWLLAGDVEGRIV